MSKSACFIHLGRNTEVWSRVFSREVSLHMHPCTWTHIHTRSLEALNWKATQWHSLRYEIPGCFAGEKTSNSRIWQSFIDSVASDECMCTTSFLCLKNTCSFMLYAYINNNLKLNKLFISNFSAVSVNMLVMDTHSTGISLKLMVSW